MGFSNKTLDRLILEPLIEREGWDTATEYGEPGYQHYGVGEPRLIVLGDFWCRCGKHPRTGQRQGGIRGDEPVEAKDLHCYEEHHPLAWQALEESGVEFEWRDEWMVDYDTGKAYRTTGDSYTWQPSVIYDWEYDHWLTPDTPIEDWVAWAANDHERCLLSNLHGPGDLETIGFQEWNRGRDGAWSDGPYETGWHAGQNDSPKDVFDTITDTFDKVEVVFCIVENSQFYTRWAAFYRTADDREEVDA